MARAADLLAPCSGRFRQTEQAKADVQDYDDSHAQDYDASHAHRGYSPSFCIRETARAWFKEQPNAFVCLAHERLRRIGELEEPVEVLRTLM